jgi:DNA mismatch repair protein MutL
MSKIRVLSDILANKIAAGEIVERPASVVKELLENSIDAGARTLQVAIEAGGKKLICVRDDGEGMSQDDAILAFEHHATSKLRTAEDLEGIATLGFRGEALPSIGAISRLTLKTRAASGDSPTPGTQLEIQGGSLRGVTPVAWDQGTEVTVRDLFYNVPARRKFLRSHDTETAHITRLVTQYAIVRPEMRCTLESDGRRLIDVVPANSVRERLYQLFGDQYLDNLVQLEGRSGNIEVRGFGSRPQEQRSNPYSMFFFVNRRMVRDRIIMSAIRQAYRNCMPASAYPVVQLFVELPYDEVDVNAHPAKIEIRFRQQSLVHDLIRETIERALILDRSIPHYGYQAQGSMGSTPGAEGALGGIPSGVGSYSVPATGASEAPVNAFQQAFQYPIGRHSPIVFDAADDHQKLRVRGDLLLDAPAEDPAPFHPKGIKILGQIQESYIIAADDHGLLIVDQHVAHERILYEQLAGSARRNEVATQGLLVPLTVELSPQQMATLQRVLTELQRNGFQVELFGGNTVLLRSVPAIAKPEEVSILLAELLEGVEQEERTMDLERIRDRIAVGTACRSAIKVHTLLSIDKMQWLVDELARVRIPTHCPHGRPIILRFSLHEIERNFGRI